MPQIEQEEPTTQNVIQRCLCGASGGGLSLRDQLRPRGAKTMRLKVSAPHACAVLKPEPHKESDPKGLYRKYIQRECHQIAKPGRSGGGLTQEKATTLLLACCLIRNERGKQSIRSYYDFNQTLHISPKWSCCCTLSNPKPVDKKYVLLNPRQRVA